MPFQKSDYDKFFNYCKDNLDLTKRPEPIVNYLPICIMDAVFSIGVNYGACVNLVNRYIEYFHYQFTRGDKGSSAEHTVTEFLDNIDKAGGSDAFAAKVLCNRQRTSARNGILKAEACRQFAEILKSKGIDNCADFVAFVSNPVAKENLDAEICKIKGQGSGVMLRYFYKLIIKANQVKDDRWVIRFTQEALGQNAGVFSFMELNDIFGTTAERMKKDLGINDIDIGILDFIVWDYMSSKRP